MVTSTKSFEHLYDFAQQAGHDPQWSVTEDHPAFYVLIQTQNLNSHMTVSEQDFTLNYEMTLLELSALSDSVSQQVAAYFTQMTNTNGHYAILKQGSAEFLVFHLQTPAITQAEDSFQSYLAVYRQFVDHLADFHSLLTELLLELTKKRFWM